MKKTMLLGIMLTLFVSIGLFADWTELQKILASDGATDDAFGVSASIDENYSIIGAPCDDDNGYISGSAYIFHRIGSTWSEQAKITASDGAANDYFGGSVSIDGDYAVIGARADSSSSGSAYIFHRIGTTWSQQAKITANDGITWKYFGISVSIAGDYIVVGTCDCNGSSSGSAYIFHRIGSTWTEQAMITASDGAAYDRFGK